MEIAAVASFAALLAAWILAPGGTTAADDRGRSRTIPQPHVNRSDAEPAPRGAYP